MTHRAKYWRECLAWMLALLLLAISADGYAEANALRAIDVVREGVQPQLRLQFQQPLAIPPSSFSTTSPPRIVIDLPDTVNATGQARRMVDRGEVRHVDIVQATGRMRLVFNLKRSMSFSTEVRDRELLVVLSEVSAGAASAARAAGIASERNAIVDIDFRRGDGGAGQSDGRCR